MAYKAVIIDDEAWTRDTIKKLGHWHKYGFMIAGEAADGISGIACIKTLQPDLIVTDMHMPGLDGAGMLKMMQEENLRSKVIVVSGYDDFHYTRQALSSKVMDYLLKPIKEEEFNSLLEQCAAELKASDFSGWKSSSGLLGYVGKEWMENYRNSREEFRVCLEGLSEKGLSRCTRQLQTQLSQEMAAEGRLRVLIKVNYDLLRIVEETAISLQLEPDDELRESEIPYTIKESSTAEELLLHYLENGRKLVKKAENKLSKSGRIDLDSLKEYIQQNYGENITLVSMAERCHISKEYLSALFKKETGQTFSEYLTHVRMLKAKSLIVEYRLPIQKVAEMTGYLDIAHFYKSFKKYFHTSPGKLRGEE